MSDIVERLGKRVRRGRGPVGGWVPDPVSIEARDEIVRLRAERDMLRDNRRETFEAMVAMRNELNEHIPLPSLESDLLKGPEDSVFCSSVARAVIEEVEKLRAERDRPRDALTGVVIGWEALAGGRDYSPREIEQWLIEYMKPAIDKARAALKGDTP